VICAGYLGQQIETFVQDGAGFGCSVRYSWDGPTLLGTGGALRQALPKLPGTFFVLYGDSYLPTPYRPVWDAFCASKLPALMTVFRNEGRWDTSNVEYVDGTIRRYDKVNRTPQMLHIDYGLGVLDAATVSVRPADQAWDLAELYGDLVSRNLLAGYEVAERFYEIGSRTGILETEAFLQADGHIAPVSGMQG